jgi:hypothetical protein
LFGNRNAVAGHAVGTAAIGLYGIAPNAIECEKASKMSSEGPKTRNLLEPATKENYSFIFTIIYFIIMFLIIEDSA